MVELLAPAGDINRAKMAFLYGADAIYCGGIRYGLRANAKNFKNDELKEIIDYAHNIKKKVYVTVNIIFHNSDLDGLIDYLKYLSSINVDGIVASDIVVVELIKKHKLNLFVVLSTQNSVLNVGTVNFWKKLGVKRIVLAREANRDNIKRIIDTTGIEVETFIHGSMCTSISGKCVLSNYITNRDANRGGCAQVCRWNYKLDSKPDFTMMSKDLNMVQYIEDLINIGVVSFKIEGRMRSIYYIATVILTYRRIIDGIKNKTLNKKDYTYYLNVLNRCANRESAPQFYAEDVTYKDEYWNGRFEQTNQDFLGVVLDYNKEDKIATIEQRNYFKIGDEVQFFGPNIETFNYVIHKIYDEYDNNIAIANHPNMIVKIPVKKSLNKFDLLRIKVFDKD